MRSARPVLVVEDDAALRASLCERLAADGAFAAVAAGSASEAEARLVDQTATRYDAPRYDAPRYDAVLLDVGLPDGDGCELCARLRRRGLRVPVIMLSGADGEADVVRGLAAGADDYVAKPFRPAELLARLRAQLRTFDAGPHAPLPVGPYDFRPSARQLVERATGRRVRLCDKEAAVLLRLCRAHGEPVARRVLLEEVWGYSAAAETRTLTTHLYSLRQKIEAEPAKPAVLLTVGAGTYCIVRADGAVRHAQRDAGAAAQAPGRSRRDAGASETPGLRREAPGWRPNRGLDAELERNSPGSDVRHPGHGEAP
jgi:DNA-binding response OmpR family regulator